MAMAISQVGTNGRLQTLQHDASISQTQSKFCFLPYYAVEFVVRSWSCVGPGQSCLLDSLDYQLGVQHLHSSVPSILLNTVPGRNGSSTPTELLEVRLP